MEACRKTDDPGPEGRDTLVFFWNDYAQNFRVGAIRQILEDGPKQDERNSSGGDILPLHFIWDGAEFCQRIMGTRALGGFVGSCSGRVFHGVGIRRVFAGSYG